MKKLLFILIPILFISCVPKSQYEQVVAENEALKTQIDELINGEERLAAIIDKAYKDEDFITAKNNIALLSEKHPESSLNEHYSEVLASIIEKEKEIAEQKRKEAEEAERIRNLNNTGEWKVWNYVDSFGEDTDKKYIFRECKGTFSNVATTNSKLSVRFLIDGKNKISIKLYEYDDNTEVKGGYGSSKLRGYLTIRDKDGKDSDILSCENTSDRFTFGANASAIIHNALMKEGPVKFSMNVYEDYGSDSSYKFTIESTKYYDNAYRILTTGK